MRARTKQLASNAVLRLASVAGPHRWSARLPRLWILMYHRILPREEALASGEEPGMYVHPATFDRHLGWVREQLQIVRLEDWVARVREGREVPGRACAITFDDGWRDNFEHALPILRRHAVPATLFAVSELIGTNGQFWPGRLARLVEQRADFVRADPALQWLRDAAGVAGIDIARASRDANSRSALIGACKTLSDDRISTGLDEAERASGLAPPQQRSLMDWDELSAMVGSGLVDVGSHTRHHYRLRAELDCSTMEAEIRASRSRLEAELGRSVGLFCYPNGDYTPKAARLVDEVYTAAVTTQRGINTSATPLNRLCRIGMHQDVTASRHAFLARLSGWF